MAGIVARHAAPTGPWWRQPVFLVLLLLGAVVAFILAAGILSVRHSANRDCVAGDHRGPCKAAAALQQQVKSLGATPVTSVPPPAPTVTVIAPPRVHEIASTAIISGHLWVTYRNPVQAVDLGRVAGAQGLRGKRGASGRPAPTLTPSPGRAGSDGSRGRGITGAIVTSDGHLLLSFTDDTTQDVGVVVGKDGKDGIDGVSFRSVAIVNGHLIVTLSDGTTQDAGELPVGPPCPAGYSQATVRPHPVESPGQTWVVCASN
jgi:hypothetical protein